MKIPFTNRRQAYGEAMRELSEHGESPERLPRDSSDFDRRGSAAYPEGFYGERNWE
jgi:hypothetical protein